jgi:hypothetical protein
VHDGIMHFHIVYSCKYVYWCVLTTYVKIYVFDRTELMIAALASHPSSLEVGRLAESIYVYMYTFACNDSVFMFSARNSRNKCIKG